jgi:hypothetical protein
VRAPAGPLKRATIDRVLHAWSLYHARVMRLSPGNVSPAKQAVGSEEHAAIQAHKVGTDEGPPRAAGIGRLRRLTLDRRQLKSLTGQ